VDELPSRPSRHLEHTERSHELASEERIAAGVVRFARGLEVRPRRYQQQRRRQRKIGVPGALSESQGICKSSLAYSVVMVDVFRALDDETRRLVLDELSVRDGQTLFEICSTLTMRHGLSLTRQAISQHLGVLESAGLVVTQRRGRSKFHYFNPEPLAEITARWPTRKRTEQ
jgi:DNA-binding transcriptional ArsR family regulator